MIYLTCITLIGIGRIWTKFYKALNERVLHSWYETVLHKSFLTDIATFRNFTRMNPSIFTELGNFIGPLIIKQNTWMRRSISISLCCSYTLFVIYLFVNIYITMISINERLAMTLRYLATEDLPGTTLNFLWIQQIMKIVFKQKNVYFTHAQIKYVPFPLYFFALDFLSGFLVIFSETVSFIYTILPFWGVFS